jgi:hypothetical protein
MNCDAVMNELVDYIDGRCGRFTRIRVRRHLDRCEDCVQALREEEDLNERLAFLEDETPPEEVWRRIRETVSTSALPETIPPTWWERVRSGTLRYAMPYALGVATTALLIMAGLGRPEVAVTGPEPPGSTPPTVARDEPASPLDEEWIRTVGGPAPVRAGEMPLELEDPRDLVIIRPQKDFERVLEILRKRGVKPEEVETIPATPVSSEKKTH